MAQKTSLRFLIFILLLPKVTASNGNSGEDDRYLSLAEEFHSLIHRVEGLESTVRVQEEVIQSQQRRIIVLEKTVQARVEEMLKKRRKRHNDITKIVLIKCITNACLKRISKGMKMQTALKLNLNHLFSLKSDDKNTVSPKGELNDDTIAVQRYDEIAT